MISFDFSATACCANTQRARPAKALTRCSAGCLHSRLPPERFAIDTDLLADQIRQGIGRPRGERRSERHRIDPRHPVAQGIVRRDTIAQRQPQTVLVVPNLPTERVTVGR